MAEHGSTSSPFQRRYPPKPRERAVRMVFETASERSHRFGAVARVAQQLGIGPESLQKWLSVFASPYDCAPRPNTTV